MSGLAWWVSAALGLDWWTVPATGRRRWPWLLSAELVASVGGTSVGRRLGSWLPPPGGVLLGAGVLGCLGLLALAETGGALPLAWGEGASLFTRALAAGTGLGLVGLTVPAVLPALLLSLAVTSAAALAVEVNGTRLRTRLIRLHFLSGALLCGVSLLTFRGVT